MEFVIVAGVFAGGMWYLNSRYPAAVQRGTITAAPEQYTSYKAVRKFQNVAGITYDKDPQTGLPVAFLHYEHGPGAGFQEMVWLQGPSQTLPQMPTQNGLTFA